MKKMSFLTDKENEMDNQQPSPKDFSKRKITDAVQRLDGSRSLSRGLRYSPEDIEKCPVRLSLYSNKYSRIVRKALCLGFLFCKERVVRVYSNTNIYHHFIIREIIK